MRNQEKRGKIKGKNRNKHKTGQNKSTKKDKKYI